MWYLIVTSRCLLWSIMSLLATFMVQEALFSPNWLKVDTTEERVFPVNLGVCIKCDVFHENCRNLITQPDDFPVLSKTSAFFFVSGIIVMCATICIGISGYFLQSIFKKSIFIISGATQVIAGMCFIMGIMLYPMGWGSLSISCGEDASPFYPGNCSIGPGLWIGVSGTLLTFASAYLSSTAQKSTNTYKVQEKINKGYKLVCLV